MNLLVDIGNTAIKWSLAEEEVGNTTSCSYQGDQLTEVLNEHWSELSIPEQILVSNVGGPRVAEQLNQWVHEAWQLIPEYATVSRSACGVVNAYPDVSEYGIDRWMALIAAWHKYRTAVFLVDCGTAITLDVIDQDARHQGGLILPGFAMMHSALFSHTSNIPVSETPPAMNLGNNTAEAVSNGCLIAIVSLIERVYQDIQSSIGHRPLCVLTGGAASIISSALDLEHRQEPDLVLEGLLYSKDISS